MSDPVQSFANPQQLGRYRVERPLGTGGHSRVFLAWDEGAHGFRKRVALKVLPTKPKAGAAEALRREARLLAVLNHPNVIDVFGVGEISGVHYIAMEYVPGRNLAEIRDQLEHHGLRFPRSVVCDVAIAASEALYAAWNAQDSRGNHLKIVHRDLKPANVLLSHEGVVKVGDFGIAKAAADPDQTHGKRVKGTPSYMPPEVMRGSRHFRPSMDLWSLGVMLWEMCTGHRFYGRVALHQLLRKLDSRTPGEEAAAVAGYFPEIAPVVRRLLARAPEDRYQDPFDVARDVRRIRARMAAAPSLVEFSRLVRGRAEEVVTTDHAMPAVAAVPEDWQPLIALKRTRPRPTRTEPIRLVADISEVVSRAHEVPHVAVEAANDRSGEIPLHPPPAAVSALHALNPSAQGVISARRLPAQPRRRSSRLDTLLWTLLGGLGVSAVVAALLGT